MTHRYAATPQATASIWMDSPVPHVRHPLPTHTTADVCVVGAGIAGLTTAYLAARGGKRVVVLEAMDELGLGDSGRTTAHLTTVQDDRYMQLEVLHGFDAAHILADSHAAAIDCIEEIVREEKIECGFRRVDGYLHLGSGGTRESLARESDAARRAGIDVELLERSPEPSFDRAPCLRFPRQAQLHPIRYLAGLVRALERLGGRVFTDAHVRHFHGGASPRAVLDDGETISAPFLVVATHAPVNDRFVIHTKQSAMRTYAMAFEIPRGAIPLGLHWDTDRPYHYVRVDDTVLGGASQLLIVGGEDHRTGQDEHPEPRWDRLESWARQRFASLGEVVRRWSGQIEESLDGVGFIGRNPNDGRGVLVVTGGSGNGMTHGTVAALMFREMIEGREHPWAHVYDPRRRNLRSFGAYARENLGTVAQYAAWALPGEVQREEDIRPGEGATLLSRGRRLAVFRDEDGNYHRCRAACTHLGGVVRWNGAEKTWDCPCHGSRFDRHGRVIAGPAPRDLAPEAKKPARVATPGAAANTPPRRP